MRLEILGLFGRMRSLSKYGLSEVVQWIVEKQFVGNYRDDSTPPPPPPEILVYIMKDEKST
jgi:hypothetical protein